MSSFFLPSKPPNSDRKRKKMQSNVRWALIRKYYFNNRFCKENKSKSCASEKEEVAS